MICCNYRLINTCFNCLFDCAYCYLHSYLNAFGIVQFSNVEEIYGEMALFLEQADRDRIYRIGTGEFTDSLMMDEISGIGRTLIGMTRGHRNIMIEFKTKSDNIDHLLEIKEKGNAVLAWSLNTERNISRYEKDAAPLGERLRAAEKAAAAGYWLAFHFDPIILYGAGEREYADLVDLLFERINPAKVVWISLGGFRYAPGFKESLRTVFPGEDLTLEEMFPGEDGKLRYLKGKRIGIYRKMKENILRHTDKPFVYLCMESADVWREVFGKDYRSSRDLEADMGSHLEKNFIGPV
jgi:spore photoproduct lyase